MVGSSPQGGTNGHRPGGDDGVSRHSAFNAVAVCRAQKAQRPSMPHSIVHRVRKEDSFVGKAVLRGRSTLGRVLKSGEGGTAQKSDQVRKLRNNWKGGCMKMQITLHLATLQRREAKYPKILQTSFENGLRS